MNILSYKMFDDNGGSFVLLVDGIELAELVNFDDSLIPFWISGKGIPTFPPHQSFEDVNERIIAVCGCGEYGCDCLTCKIEIEDEFVKFYEFKRPSFSRVIDKTFRFTKENFREVEKQIAIDAEKIKKSFENKV